MPIPKCMSLGCGWKQSITKGNDDNNHKNEFSYIMSTPFRKKTSTLDCYTMDLTITISNYGLTGLPLIKCHLNSILICLHALDFQVMFIFIAFMHF